MSDSGNGKPRGWIRIAVLLIVVFSVAGVLALKDRDAVTEPNAEATANTDQALPRMVDLGADKCIPCKTMAPILKKLRVDLAGQCDINFIDVWKNPDEGPKYGVKVIPTQIFYDAAGKELFRHEGFFSREDILGKFAEHGITFELEEI